MFFGCVCTVMMDGTAIMQLSCFYSSLQFSPFFVLAGVYTSNLNQTSLKYHIMPHLQNKCTQAEWLAFGRSDQHLQAHPSLSLLG